jgi:hypothetical protein
MNSKYNFKLYIKGNCVGVDLQITMKSGNEKQKSTQCRIHSKIQTKHRRKKGANSIPFNTQIHANPIRHFESSIVGIIIVQRPYNF